MLDRSLVILNLLVFLLASGCGSDVTNGLLDRQNRSQSPDNSDYFPITLAPSEGLFLGDGLVVENQAPAYKLDDSRADIRLRPALATTTGRQNDAALVYFGQRDPQDGTLRAMRISGRLLVRRHEFGGGGMAADKKYFDLYFHQPSADQREAKLIHLGIFAGAKNKPSPLSLSQGMRLHPIATDRPRYESDFVLVADLEIRRLRVAVNAGQPAFADECTGRPEEEGCVGPAPVLQADPFENVGMIDTTLLTAMDASRRQYMIHDQAPLGAEIEITFVAKNIAAGVEDNAQQCKDLFYPSVWSIGARVNSACYVTPAASSMPVNGKLACRVNAKFVNDVSVYDRNCYISGVFSGEEAQIETIQLFNRY